MSFLRRLERVKQEYAGRNEVVKVAITTSPEGER